MNTLKMNREDNKIVTNNSIKIKGSILDLSEPKVMGVLNINDNSFYEGSRVLTSNNLLSKVDQYLSEGAAIIDIGAVSTRPGADLENAKAEMRRLLPAIHDVRKHFPETIISVDTFRSEVAKAAVIEGADIVNDVYGGRYDDEMFNVVAQLDVPYMLMHSRGFSKDMTRKTGYNGVVRDVVKELSYPLKRLRSLGVKDVVLDPGFGFAKTLKENHELLRDLEVLHLLGCPVLAGVSRKSMIYKKLKIKPEDSLNGTTVLNTLAILKGAKILRVHDVKPAVEVINLLK
jgi:dihydropteroate synthase